MEYVARHYFPLKTGLATPGEILTDLPEDIVPRLLAKGAIETIAPATAAAKPEKKPAKKAKAQPEEAPEAEAPETETPETEVPEAEAETEAQETEDTEPDEEVEIDALDGVVTEPKEEEKPKGRKKSDKAKGGKA